MKNALLIVGKNFEINPQIFEYLKREACKKIGKIDLVYFIGENDKDLFLEISESFKKFDNLLISTSNSSYPTVSKIVATLFNDNLVVKEETLVPSKCSVFEKNSFLIEEENRKVNVLKIEELNRLPKILLDIKLEYAVLNIFNLSIKEAKEKLSNLANSYDIHLTYTYLTHNWIKAVAKNSKFGDLAMFVQNAKLLMPNNIVVAENIFEYLIERFSALHKTVTFAESCTGGLLASLLTKVPGSSAIFKGSLVTYSNEIKSSWLGVKPEILKEFGAVSKETVEGMLKGALKVSESDYAMAISGIAGPGGATPTKPVGTVVVGAKSKDEQIIEVMHFEGDRNYIQDQAALYAVKLLFDIAKEELF